MATLIVVTDSGRSHQWTQSLVDRGLFDKEQNTGTVLEIFPQKELPITKGKMMTL